jgi:hypothetical protein
MGVAVVVALAAIVHAIVILTGGEDLIKKAAANELGLSAEEAALLDSVDIPSSVGQDVFNNRAYAVLVCGILLLVFGLLMRKAAMWARILVTLTALGAAGMSLIIVRDITTGLMAALGWVTIIGAVVAIVLAWLPAHSHYAKASR